MVEAINQAECTECDDSSFDVTFRHFVMPHESEPYTLARALRVIECDCGANGHVEISENGVSAIGAVSYENASWNEGDEDE